MPDPSPSEEAAKRRLIRYFTRMGDRRERAVLCSRCRAQTFALDALCDRCDAAIEARKENR